jgi:hypothetical protein
VRFESIVFCVEPDRKRRRRGPRTKRPRFDAGDWRVASLPIGDGVYEATPATKWRRSDVSVAAAWERVYELRADPRVRWAEPMFEITTPQAAEQSADHDPATDDFEWSLKEMRVKQAWARFTHGHPGAGITVGHPDTGFTEHDEIFNPRLRAADGFNFEEKDHKNDAHDTLAGRLGRNPGHGTKTASVIMSGEGIDVPVGIPERKFVSGTAPAADLVPIRTTKTATIWNPSHLIKAIGYATTGMPCEVISISLGGPFAARGLRTAVKNAEAAGIIVVAGAGNVAGPIRGVGYPAAFTEVIGVAASEIHEQPWDGSCRGPEVDISAPGAFVWCAETRKTKKGIRFDVVQDSGTSFGTAGVAGIAALWISFHGRIKLIKKYGVGGIPAVFKQLLQSTCTKKPGWPADTFGPGIANADALLKARLPKRTFPGIRANGRKPADEDDVLEQLVNLAYPAPRSGIALVMALVLRVTETMLKAALHEVGDEIVFRVATNLTLRQSLHDAATSAIERDETTIDRTREGWVAALRRQLSGRAASRQLREALEPRRRRSLK